MSSLDAQLDLARSGFRLQVSLTAPAGAITGVFGPSGSGKTTLLRCIAGLEPRVVGHVRLGPEIWQQTDHDRFRAPHQRASGMVFQDGRLFPHLSVAANLDYAHRRAPAGGPQRAQVVEALGIGDLLPRTPEHLSGGEQQRVAIARALLSNPSVLLLDEPLAAVDRDNKAEILPYLERLRAQFALPMIYVTHSLEELLYLADRMVLMERGRILAEGPIAELLCRPDLSLAHQQGAASLVSAEVLEHDDRYQLSRLRFDGGELVLARRCEPPGSRVRVVVRARDVSLALTPAQDSSILNILPAEVRGLYPEDPVNVTVALKLGQTPLLARITRKSCERLGLREGLQVYAQIKTVALAR